MKEFDTIPERIEQKICYEPMSGCWLWTAYLNPDGYGQVHWPTPGRIGQMVLAHRLIYELTTGVINPDLQLDHLCRNRACVNPAHLEPVTPRQNTLRGSVASNPTHCPKGHVYDERNTYIHPRRGYRACRICKADGMRGER